MINLMIKNIIDNGNKIDSVIKYVNKMNYKNYFNLLLMTISLYTVTKTVSKHEKEIKELKSTIDGMKSREETKVKGE